MSAPLRLAAALLGLTLLPALGWAGTVENLERERSITIQTMLDPSLTPDQRQRKLEVSERRLVDLERMVMRDKSLEGDNSPAVRRAFDNYDLTFLAHGALERNKTLAGQWLGQIKLDSADILAARMGRR